MLVVQIEYVRFLDVTVGGDEQVGQRPLGCAETFDFGRLVETFLCDGVSRISKRLALFVVSIIC